MIDPYVSLSYWQVAAAASLIVVNGLVSLTLKLRMEKLLLVASIRTVVQLLMMGMVLEWVFQLDRWYVVIGLALLMTVIAGMTAVSRNERRYPGIRIHMVVSVWASSWLIMAVALAVIMHGIGPWYQPQYVIPLLGMILGNTLNGVSVGLNTLTESLKTRRDEVDTLLALGATRWEAARQPLQRAVRTGMIPIVNSMMIVGLVSLPGMMTGQLIAGMAPIQAVKYQIVIMFLIASATALGTVGTALFCWMRVFNGNHQFLPEQITDR